MVGMMGDKIDRVCLGLAGEKMQFLFNVDKNEVYNPLFPGIKIEKVYLNCGHIVPHDILLKIVQEKSEEFQLAMARAELAKSIKDFKDYSEYF